jgi:Ser/Thr protein kinase RdoA (MazF antagonist)
MNDAYHEAEQNVAEDLLDLNLVMQAFGVSTWTNLGTQESLPSQGLNLLVEVDGERYLLRERPEAMVGEDISHRYAFQHSLQQHGIPIPALRFTTNGEMAVTIGEDSFELQHVPVGELFSTSIPQSLDWVQAAGGMLARIHQASHHYQGHVHRWPSEVHIGAVVQSYLNLAHMRAETSPVRALAAALDNWAEQWEAILPSAMMSIGSGRNLPEFHIHGDYHALNLRFDEYGVASVMGLEASRWEKRLFEVAYGLFYFSALVWQPGEHLTRPLVKRGFEPERGQHFLHAYREIYAPEPDEAALLADALMLVAPIATANGPLEDLFYLQEEVDEASIEDILERLSWASSLPAWLGRVRRSIAEMWL